MLRPYQTELLNATRTSLVKNKRIICQLPTGGGKTIIFISIIKQAVARGTTVLVITESRKIFKQIVEQQHGRLIAAGSNNFFLTKGQVYIAMAQTLKRRQFMLDNFAALNNNLLIISDECHVATANPIINKLPEAYLIGFTATPCAKAAPWIPNIYNHVVCGPQPMDLVLAGYLAQYKHYERRIADLTELELGGNGEYTEESQLKVFDNRLVFDGMLDDLRATSFAKAIVFTSSIKHCEHVYEQLTANGFSCACVHSKRDDTEIKKYTDGPAKIAVSVGQITKGFDYPPTDLIVLDRSIYSLPLYLQCVGRGSRISEGKPHFTVLDYGQNFSFHQAWSQDRDWTELAKPRKKKEKQQPQSVKTCPQCESLIPIATRLCPFCGYVFAPPAAEEPPPESILVEVTPTEPLYNQIRGRNIHSLTPEELSIYAKHLKKSKFATLIARFADINQPGYLKEFIAHMGYKPAYRWVLQKEELPEKKINDFVLQ